MLLEYIFAQMVARGLGVGTGSATTISGIGTLIAAAATAPTVVGSFVLLPIGTGLTLGGMSIGFMAE